MRTFFVSLLLIFDLMVGGQTIQTASNYVIPAGGATITIGQLYMPDVIYIGTNNAPVNLGGNAYTMTYSALPPAGTHWTVIMDFHQLTLVANSQVTIFGKTPLVDNPNTDTVVLDCRVMPDGVTLQENYVSPNLNKGGTFSTPILITTPSVTLTSLPANVNATQNDTLLALQKDSLSELVRCKPWCTTGNTGLTNANFLGNIDTVGLNFRVGNQPSGRIDYNQNNAFFGYGAGYKNTTANDNVAIGSGALYAGTTVGDNVAVGANAMATVTTGSNNTAIGVAAMNHNVISGSSNTAVGSNTTVGSNFSFTTELGSSATATGNYGTAIGYNASAAASQISFSPNDRLFSLPGMTSAVGNVLWDSSGNGDFISKSIGSVLQTTFTPVTGDSVAVTTPSNLVNPSGTIAVFTIILPGSPYGGQVLEFSFTQGVSSLLWSVTANMANAVNTHVPSSATAGKAFSIQYNAVNETWYNY